MVIYDKNQYRFNIIFIVILITLMFLNIYYARNFAALQEKYDSIYQTLNEIESNQNFNFIQGSHTKIDFQLTPQGLYVSANDFGLFNGPSMQPSIFDGNTVIEKTYDNSILNEGQIIRFTRKDGQAVIHRVRADYGDTVFVQGDTLQQGEIIQKDRITHVILGVLFT